jgi:hypothetical protein
VTGSSPYTNDGKAKSNGGSGFAMAPDGYGQDWSQVPPANGDTWDDPVESSEQYSSPKVNVVNRGANDGG